MNANLNEYLQAVPKAWSVQELRCMPWFSCHGDQELRLNYDLTEESIVFDLGGYEGQWANEIFSKYHCTVHIFEPVEEFGNQIERRFSDNNKVSLHRFGLAGETKKMLLSVSADGSSLFKQGDVMLEISLKKAIDFMNENDIHYIDLMKINIEGGEYDLLEHLIDANFILNITNIQIQFHDFVANASERMNKIQEALGKTHYITYQFEFVWENWRKKITPKTNQECQVELNKLYSQIAFEADELSISRRDNVLLSLKTQDTQAELQNSKAELRATQAELQSIKNTIYYKVGSFVFRTADIWKRKMLVVFTK